MRIGIFTDTYLPYISGLVTSELMLKHALEEAGHQVFVVTANLETFKYEHDEKERIIRMPGIPTGIYDARLTGIYDVRATNQIRKWDLDVIHSQSEFGIGTFARIVAKQLDIPIVHTYHTMYEDYVHYITKGYFVGASKKLVRYLTKFYCDKTIDELVVPSKKAYDLFKKQYNYERNVHIIPTGIEVERFYREKFKDKDIDKIREKYNIKKDDFVLFFVGRLGQEKSVDFLIEAHKDLIKKYNNIKLVIVGDGPEANLYHEMVLNYELNNHVIFTGKVPWDDIPKYYQLAHAFVTASRTETQGLTILEGMGASLPILCANDENFKEFVIDDLNGYLFDDKNDYINKVENLISDSKKLEYMANQARLTADNNSTAVFGSRMLNVYKIAIEKNGKKKDSFLGKLGKNITKNFKGEE